MKAIVCPALLVVAVGSLCALPSIPGRGGMGHGGLNHAAKNPDAAFCADACAAGLGAPRCGDATVCRPPTFTNATAAYVADMENKMEGADRRGKPRDELCPQLCPLALGDPLCHCKALRYGPPHGGNVQAHDWRLKACDALCKATGKSPSGCPSCTTAAAVPTLGVRDIDWDWWCHVLCLEGDGGLACLCDINP